MTAPGFPSRSPRGVGDNHDELGTDAVHISEVLQELPCPEGALVLMDLGKRRPQRRGCTRTFRLREVSDSPLPCAAPVEGAIAAAVRAQVGGTLDEVAQEAELGLVAKREQLGVESAAGSPAAAPS